MRKKLAENILPDSITLDFYGDLDIQLKPNAEYFHLNKYIDLLELFQEISSFPIEERILSLKLLNALLLGGKAKRAQKGLKEFLYEKKNQLLLSILQSDSERKRTTTTYLKGKHPYITKRCPSCQTKHDNRGEKSKEIFWCNNCDLTHAFYDVISIKHKTESNIIMAVISAILVDNETKEPLLKNIKSKKSLKGGDYFTYKGAKYLAYESKFFDSSSLIQMNNHLHDYIESKELPNSSKIDVPEIFSSGDTNEKKTNHNICKKNIASAPKLSTLF